jgi:ATP-dependent exoDNAse (exonuclease V) alpha subunit
MQRLNRPPDPQATLLRCTNREVDLINTQRYAELLDPKEEIFHAAVRGGRPEVANQIFQSVPRQLSLKKGTRVMLTRNIDVRGGLVNGATGEVVDFVPALETTFASVPSGMLLPVVDFVGIGQRSIPIVEWTVSELDRVVCTVIQIPLRHAWAITVHKAQGASLPLVDVDLSRAFDTGQSYVALSRARSMETLSVRGATPFRMMCCSIARAHDEATFPSL